MGWEMKPAAPREEACALWETRLVPGGMQKEKKLHFLCPRQLAESVGWHAKREEASFPMPAAAG